MATEKEDLRARGFEAQDTGGAIREGEPEFFAHVQLKGSEGRPSLFFEGHAADR